MHDTSHKSKWCWKRIIGVHSKATKRKEVYLNELELLIILCTATIAVSFYAGCSKIANVIGSFTINIVNDPEGQKHLQEEPAPEKKD